MMILAVGGQGGFSWQRYELKTKFPDVKGLKSGAVVRVAGVEVGKVTEVAFAGAEVEVTLEVQRGQQPRITTESRALDRLAQPARRAGHRHHPVDRRARRSRMATFRPAGRAAGQLSDVAESATQSLEQINEMLKDIRAGKGTVGKLFTDDALVRGDQQRS